MSMTLAGGLGDMLFRGLGVALSASVVLQVVTLKRLVGSLYSSSARVKSVRLALRSGLDTRSTRGGVVLLTLTALAFLLSGTSCP